MKQRIVVLETERDEWKDRAFAVYYKFEELSDFIRDNHWIRVCPPDLSLVRESQVK